MIGASKAIIAAESAGAPAGPLSAYITPTFTTYIAPNGTFITPDITANASGGTPPYTYLWTITGLIGITSTDESVTNATAGGYNVEISDTLTCTITDAALDTVEVSTWVNITFGLPR